MRSTSEIDKPRVPEAEYTREYATGYAMAQIELAMVAINIVKDYSAFTNEFKDYLTNTALGLEQAHTMLEDSRNNTIWRDEVLSQALIRWAQKEWKAINTTSPSTMESSGTDGEDTQT